MGGGLPLQERGNWAQKLEERGNQALKIEERGNSEKLEERGNSTFLSIFFKQSGIFNAEKFRFLKRNIQIFAAAQAPQKFFYHSFIFNENS